MASVGSSNITFASLRTAYNSGGEDDATGDANLQSGSIKLADFRGAGFTDDSSIPTSGSISVNDDFSGKTFGSSGPSTLTYTTDGFRVYNRWSNDSDDLYSTTSSSTYSGSGNTSNRRIKLKYQDGPAYRTMLMVPGNQSDSSSNIFFYVDRNDSNVTPVDEAEVWWKEVSSDYYYLHQWGLIPKEYNRTWASQIGSYVDNNHAGIKDRMAFHGAGYLNHAGSADYITSSSNLVEPAWEANKTYETASKGHSNRVTSHSALNSDAWDYPNGNYPRNGGGALSYGSPNPGITTNLHSVIGQTAGTQRSSNTTGRLDNPAAARKYLFFESVTTFQVYNFPYYRGDNIFPNHGMKLKYYEKTLDVKITSGSQYLTPQDGTSNWTNNTDSSTGLEGIFSGMYVLSLSTTGQSTPHGALPTATTSESETLINVYIGQIHTNRMTMYQERGVSQVTTINGTTSGNARITIGGYLFWHLATGSSYSNAKLLGPPHSVLPRFQTGSDADATNQNYRIKEWAFFMGDTGGGAANLFVCDIRNSLPSGTAFSYSVTYPTIQTAAVFPGNSNSVNLNTNGYLLLNNGTNSTSLQTLSANLNTNVVGSSVIGKTGRILLHFRTGNVWYSDIQIISINVNGSNTTIASDSGSGVSLYTNWKTKILNYSNVVSNNTYTIGDYSNYSSLVNVGTNSHASTDPSYQNRRWQRMSSGTPGSTNVGINHNSPYVMFESSGTSGSNTRSNILVSPEITFTSNNFSMQIYGWSSQSGGFAGVLRLGIELT